MDVTGDRSKIRCYKEQYCIGTWNVRSMNQGKLEVAKQEMARVNVDILGISKLKWTGMGEFNSVQFSSVTQSFLTLRPHELQHTRPPCPSPSPGVHSNSCLSSQWCHPAISCSVVPFSSCPQSIPASESFPMSQLFTWGGQSLRWPLYLLWWAGIP